uniref:Uncharacterized protein n=1 Tax=Ignisphaera aggregans TaxID=334771 RepID=A0A7J2U2P2_9CREN
MPAREAAPPYTVRCITVTDAPHASVHHCSIYHKGSLEEIASIWIVGKNTPNPRIVVRSPKSLEKALEDMYTESELRAIAKRLAVKSERARNIELKRIVEKALETGWIP